MGNSVCIHVEVSPPASLCCCYECWTLLMWWWDSVTCGYYSLEPYLWCLGILHISLTGVTIPVIADAWSYCLISRWWWRSPSAADAVRYDCWIVPSCDRMHQCLQCESFEQFVQLDGYLLVTVCTLVKGLGIVWVLRALGLLREKMFLRRGAIVALRWSSLGKMWLREVCVELTHLSWGILCKL